MRSFKKVVLLGGVGAALFVMPLTGCRMMNHQDESGRSAGRVLDDKSITADIKHSLESEAVYKYPNVNVQTFDGVVQLSGFVITDGQKQRAGELAQDVQSVNRVINNITVQPTTPTGRPNQGNPPQ